MEKKLTEETITTSYLYRGRIINVRQDQVRTGTGANAFREVVEHPGAVAIMAVTNKEEIILVRQYRQPAGEVLLEIPAGKLEPDEEPLDCARRELLEETGFEAEKWQQLCYFYPSPGFCDEKIYLFLAEDLLLSDKLEPDPDENLLVVSYSLEKAEKAMLDGTIKDGKTIIALQRALIRKKTT